MQCKLVQFVVYCVLFVIMSSNIEKNSAASEEGHSLTAYGFFQITVVSLANLHKRPEALARYYVTSYWQAEWAKKLRLKTIELPPPLPPLPLCSSLTLVNSQ